MGGWKSERIEKI